MVTLERRSIPLDGIKASALLAGAKEHIVRQFYSNFDFPAVDVYAGRWSEFEDFLEEKGMKLLYDKGIRLKKTSSLHYVADGKHIVGYVADDGGVGKLLLKSDNLEVVI